MHLDSILVGLMGSVIWFVWWGRRARATPTPRVTEPETPPQLPYRTPEDGADLPAPVRQSGPRTHCPRCGAAAGFCGNCYRNSTEHIVGDMCPSSNTKCVRFVQSQALTFTRGTSWRRYCQNDWWRTICTDAPNVVHVHQKCERCGWRGIAEITPGDSR